MVFAKRRQSFLWKLILAYDNNKQILWQIIQGYNVEQTMENSTGPVHDLS